MDFSTKSLVMEQRMNKLRNVENLDEAGQAELMDLSSKYPRQRKLDDLQLFLDYMQNHPDIPMPYFGGFTVYCNQYDDNYKDDQEKTKSYMRTIVRELKRTFGKVEKRHTDTEFSWRVTFGSDLTVDFSCSRKNVCVPKVVGRREIAETILPARTEDIIEWDCTDSVLAD